MRVNRGFTLVELLTGIAVSSIILVAIAAAVIGISGSYSNESQTRSAVEGGRTALAFIERNLKLAGYGIEPQYAFDVGVVPGFSSQGKDNYGIPAPVTPNQTPLPVPVSSGYLTDDLAFRYRDPYFVRRGTASATESGFATSEPLGRGFPRGTAFIIACPGGGQRSWFRSTADVAPADSSVPLAAYGSGQNAAPVMALDCIGQGGLDGPYLMHLREFRFRVFQDNNRAFLGFVPNLSTSVSAFPANGEVLAADVEEFQLSYVMNRPFPTSAHVGLAAPDTGGNWIMADQPGETGNATLPSIIDPMPKLDDPYESANRYNRHPANIRAVQVSFSVRSARKRASKGEGYIRGAVENGPSGGTAGDGYFRSWMSSSVRTANMTSRAFFLPPLTEMGTPNGNNDGA